MPTLYTRRSLLKHAAGWALGAGIAALDPMGLFSKRVQAATAPQPFEPVVYGWFPARFGHWRTTSLDWRSLTHLCFRAVEINADGSLNLPAGRPPRAFVEEAHRNGVKLTVLAWVTSRANSDGYLAEAQPAAVRNLLNYVRENDLDGVNIDDEKMQSFNAVAGGPNRTLVGDFFARLQDAFKAADTGYHLSYAAPPVISDVDAYGASWLDWSRIAPCIDAIIPMGYTLNPPPIGWTTNPEPLGDGGKAPNTTTRDLKTMIADYLEAMGGRREKLLAGVSLDLGGHEWPCVNDQPRARILGRGRPLDLAACEAQAKRYGKRWDEAQASAWYAGREGDHFVQGWYNDPHAWTVKLAWLREQGLGGIGVWVLDGETDPPARWELLRHYRAL